MRSRDIGMAMAIGLAAAASTGPDILGRNDDFGPLRIRSERGGAKPFAKGRAKNRERNKAARKSRAKNRRKS